MPRRFAASTQRSNSSGLSLFELRRHLLRRAGALRARARGLRDKGARTTAARMVNESQRLRDVAHRMGERRSDTS